MEALSCEHVSDSYEEYELINGEAYMMARQSFAHSDIAYNITGIFKRHLRGKRCRALQEPNVNLGEKDQFVPDVVIVCNPDILNDPWVEGVPDLVVEILSPSTTRIDRILKKFTYEKYGVREYWIVDPKNKNVEVYHLVEGKFVNDGVYHLFSENELKYATEAELSAAEAQKTIKISLYDDFIVEVKDVFEDVD